jgi:hypothetical protein
LHFRDEFSFRYRVSVHVGTPDKKI